MSYEPPPRVMVSGGFDPVHVGHVRLLQSASLLGRVAVALNSDAWLIRKKGYVLMPFEERREILLAFECVRYVGAVLDDDGTVCEAIKRYRPAFFCNGGDRTLANQDEAAMCEMIGCKQVFGVGGDEKIASSSEAVRRAFDMLASVSALGDHVPRVVGVGPDK